VDWVTLWHQNGKTTGDFAYDFAIGSLTRRFGRLKAHEERTKVDE
jgi:hypothetical protein